MKGQLRCSSEFVELCTPGVTNKQTNIHVYVYQRHSVFVIYLYSDSCFIAFLDWFACSRNKQRHPKSSNRSLSNAGFMCKGWTPPATSQPDQSLCFPVPVDASETSLLTNPTRCSYARTCASMASVVSPAVPCSKEVVAIAATPVNPDLCATCWGCGMVNGLPSRSVPSGKTASEVAFVCGTCHALRVNS